MIYISFYYLLVNYYFALVNYQTNSYQDFALYYCSLSV